MVRTNTYKTSYIFHALIGLLLCIAPNAYAQEASNALETLNFSVLPGERVELVLTLANHAQEPKSFTTDNPSRIAFDLVGTKNSLSKRNHPIGAGMVRSVTTVEAMGRTRVILNLVSMVPYKYRILDREIIITVDGSSASVNSDPGIQSSIKAFTNPPSHGTRIENIDFRRGTDGQGMVQVTVSDPSVVADLREEGKEFFIDFINTTLPEALERRLDVLDFATPVSTIDTYAHGNNVRMAISTSGQYSQFAYQADNVLTIEFKPTSKITEEITKRKEFQYTGERLSLNFQDIEVRAVLQLIADFTGFNLVASDTVSGKITLRLQNVPWDQAMDIILRTKGLAMRKSGNIVLVAPSEEIAAREKLELESQKQIIELAPLTSEYVQINYAKASDIAALLKSKENSLLSARGNVTIDERTNTLLVQDTADKISEIHRLVSKLDVPVRQVLIESRVVIANNDFTKEIGVRFGVTGVEASGNTGLASMTGSISGADTMLNSAITNIGATGQQFPITPPSVNDRLNFSLPAGGSAGSIAFAVLSDDYILDLELSALQAEGRGEIVSSPRVITSDQNTARIEQGVEIPYQEASSSGATTISFKKAVLSLEVTPQITPDDRIIMDLIVNKDNPDFSRSVLGVPPVDTRSIETKVLVDNGETVVLGGVYEQTKTNNITKVPFFGDLPLIGALFRNKSETDNKNELLIFVTPRILKESLSAQ